MSFKENIAEAVRNEVVERMVKDRLGTLGQIFFVTADSEKLNDLTPLFDNVYTTIDAAVSAASASRGDVVVVDSEYTQTVSAAAGIALDVAGVTIIGLGNGSLRPTITLDTATTADIAVSAADVKIKNMIFTANFADIATCFEITTAKNFTVEDCDFKATATNMNFENIFTTAATSNAADGLTVKNCSWIDPDTGATAPCLIDMDGTNDSVTVDGNYVHLGVKNNIPALMQIADGKVVTNLRMVGNTVIRLNTDTATGAILLHTNGSTLTGVVSGNFAQHADTVDELLITASSGLAVFNNYASGVAGASGYILPAVDS